MSRTVCAVVTCRGTDVGAVGPFPVGSPWWADVEPVAAHLTAILGVPVVVLRLMSVDGGEPPRDGLVTYHAEALDPPHATLPPATGTERAAAAAPAAHRAGWATAEGVRAALAWAYRHCPDADPPRQIKSWNLSGLFRFDTDHGLVWLKTTPPFAAFEPAVTARIAEADPDLVPPVLAADSKRRRVLYAHVPGRDAWDADDTLIEATVRRWIAAQAALAGSTGGLRDWRAEYLPGGLRRLLAGPTGAQFAPAEYAAATDLADRLPALVAELRACGLPDTVVHGDFHPGNWRAHERGTVLIDFADAYFGSPAFDGERLRAFVSPDRRPVVVAAWVDEWTRRVPGSDPARALELARSLQAIHNAILYASWLERIEPSEYPYHAADPVAGILTALAATD